MRFESFNWTNSPPIFFVFYFFNSYSRANRFSNVFPNNSVFSKKLSYKSLFMYFELQKFQSRLKTKNSENIWKQISQNISCREMRFCPQSSNKLYLLQKDFSEKSFSYYHLTGTSFPRGQPHNNKSLGECQAKAKIVWAKGHQIVAKYSNYRFNSEGNVVGSKRSWKMKRFHSEK